jgi:hypothetical protein
MLDAVAVPDVALVLDATVLDAATGLAVAVELGTVELVVVELGTVEL